jgi:hypothetical protein
MSYLRPLVLTIPAVLLAGCAGCGDGHEVAHPASYTGGTTYYIDRGRGHNSSRGTSPKAPWRNLAPVQQGDLGGGDAILLRGGQTFRGSLGLTQDNLTATSRGAKLTISSYGGGRATIAAPAGSDAISASNVAGIRISRVDLVGRGDLAVMAEGPRACRDGPSGIRVAAEGLGGTLDQGVEIDNAEISRFCEGINISSADDDSRISHVRVKGVSAHDNGDAGVWTHDAALAHHAIRDVRVTRTRAYRNLNRGGIVLFGVDRGTVTHSVAFANAKRGGGGVGIWAFDSNRIRITRNEAYRNGRRRITDDGDGFDLDRGVSNSVMAHNYSHDNGGIGFLVCSCEQYARYYRMHDVLVRDNVSRADGSSGQPSLYVLGGEPMRNVRIESNRIHSARGDGPLISVGTLALRYRGVRISGNRFTAGGSKPLLELDGPANPPNLLVGDNIWRQCGTGVTGGATTGLGCRTEAESHVFAAALSR